MIPIFYIILFTFLYISIPLLCWRRWTEEDKEMQEERRKARELEEVYKKIIERS